MGRVGGCQGQAHAYSVGLAEEGLSFSFLDSRRPRSLVLKATGDSGLFYGGGPSIRPSCNVSMNEKGVSPRASTCVGCSLTVQVACAGGAGAANGCTASRSPIALRIARKLLSAGLPFGESVR